MLAYSRSKGAQKLRRISAKKQKLLDALMAKNNDGELTPAEQKVLRRLVREAEELTLANARMLAKHQSKAPASR